MDITGILKQLLYIQSINEWGFLPVRTIIHNRNARSFISNILLYIQNCRNYALQRFNSIFFTFITIIPSLRAIKSQKIMNWKASYKYPRKYFYLTNCIEYSTGQIRAGQRRGSIRMSSQHGTEDESFHNIERSRYVNCNRWIFTLL